MSACQRVGDAEAGPDLCFQEESASPDARSEDAIVQALADCALELP